MIEGVRGTSIGVRRVVAYVLLLTVLNIYTK